MASTIRPLGHFALQFSIDAKVTGSSMASRGFAHSQPLTRHLADRTLARGLSSFPGKGALQAKRAPRAVYRDILRPWCRGLSFRWRVSQPWITSQWATTTGNRPHGTAV